MARLGFEAEIQSALACRLMALTWTRTGELREMKWTEIEGDVWSIPAKRMKKSRDHAVPLSTQALAIIAKLRARNRGSEFVFPNDRRLDRPMSENAVLYLIDRMGFGGRMTGHGWRTVGSTWANENGYSADAIEKQLAHEPDDKVRAAYNRAEFMPERRVMLQDFADWLMPPVMPVATNQP
jgi:integrase